MIYCGELGEDSSKLIQYFEVSNITTLPILMKTLFLHVNSIDTAFYIHSVAGYFWGSKNQR